MRDNKATQDELDAFDAKIHKEEGKLGYLELSKLNTVKKKMYVEMVVKDDDAMRKHLEDVKN